MNVRNVDVGRVGVCMLCVCDNEERDRGWVPTRSSDSQKLKNFFLEKSVLVVYYESIKRELKTKLIYECRCDERLKTRVEESDDLFSAE